MFAKFVVFLEFIFNLCDSKGKKRRYCWRKEEFEHRAALPFASTQKRQVYMGNNESRKRSATGAGMVGGEFGVAQGYVGSWHHLSENATCRGPFSAVSKPDLASK